MTPRAVRLRLALGFAAAMLVVLAAGAVFVHARLRADLDDALLDTLRSRADDVAALAAPAAPPRSGEAVDESFSELLAAGAPSRALTAAELRRAARGELVVDRDVRGIEGTARILARPAGARIVVVAATLENRDETLARLDGAFAIGAPLAALLVAGLGWVLASAGVAPVEALRRRTARAALERERRFVADAAHELRTPLAVIKTELDAALRAPDPRASLLAAAEETDGLVQLADDLLVLARSSDGALPVRRERVDAAELLGRVRERFVDRAREQRRAIALDVPAGLQADIDPIRAAQALGNLVDNALRHGAGTITLRARPGVLEVSDEGDALATLGEAAFARFVRADERSRGAGLGLAIVRVIAEAHGGGAEIIGPATVRLTF